MSSFKWPPQGGSGGVISINGDTTPAQLIVGGTGISVSTSAGTTTITNTLPGPTGSGTNDRIVRWDGTTAIQDSLVGISDTGQIYYTTETTTYWARTSANVWDFVQSNNRLFRLDNGVTFYDPASVTRNINYSFSTTAAFLSLVGGIKEHVFTSSSTADTIVSIANTSSGGDTWSFYSSGSASGQGGPGDFSLRNSSLTPININTKAAMLLGAPSVGTDGKRNAVTCIGLNTTGIGGTTTANATTSITGSGTAFNTSLGLGDRIALSSATSTLATVTAVASNTSATVDIALGNGTSQTINRRRAIFGCLDASANPVMLLNDQGNLLIGNVSSVGGPKQLLHIDGGTTTAAYTVYTNSVTGRASTDGLLIGIDASGNGVINQREALPITISVNGTDSMVFNSDNEAYMGTLLFTDTTFTVGRTRDVQGLTPGIGLLSSEQISTSVDNSGNYYGFGVLPFVSGSNTPNEMYGSFYAVIDNSDGTGNIFGSLLISTQNGGSGSKSTVYGMAVDVTSSGTASEITGVIINEPDGSGQLVQALDVRGTWGVTVLEDITTGTINAYDVQRSYVYFDAGAVTLNGMANGRSGKRVVLAGNTTSTLNHLSGSASSGNKFVTPTAAALALVNDWQLEVIYNEYLDSGNGAWQVLWYNL